MKIPGTIIGLAAFVVCAFVLRQGSAASAKCAFPRTTSCFKSHLNDLTGNLTDLTRKQGAALDAALTNYTKRFSAAFQCFVESEKRCASSQETQYIGRVQSTSDLLVRELTNKTALTAIVTAYKCHDVERFTPCMSKAIRDFLSEPLKTSKADAKKLCSNVDDASKTCLVARNCTPAAEPGKKAVRKLFTSFRTIWGCKGGSGAPAATSVLPTVSVMLALIARKML
ncbi:uncharacterized protein ISCGN_028141 [Ixodes scapularis]